MPAADGNGLVTWTVAFGKPTIDALGMKTFKITTSNTGASLGAIADNVATLVGLTVTATSYSLMYFNRETQLPLIEARATTVLASVIPNGTTVLLVPGA